MTDFHGFPSVVVAATAVSLAWYDLLFDQRFPMKLKTA